MAHNLSFTESGVPMMAYQGSTPWHRLGKRLQAGADVHAAIAAASLDWRVEVRPVFLEDGRKVPDRFAVIRETSGRPILGTVGPQFTPIQNADAIGVLQPACERFGLTIEAAGALGQGERVWALARMPEPIEPVKGDTVNGYVLICNGHDGTMSLSARLTPIRVVCQNTLTAALGGSAAPFVAVRHTQSATDRTRDVERIVSAMVAGLKQTGDTFARLAGELIGPNEIAAYIERVLPKPADAPLSDTLKRRRETVAHLVFHGRGAGLAGADPRGYATPWGMYNAVCEYFDHVRTAEARSSSAKHAAAESAVFGSAFNIKVRALQAARELVAV